MKLQVSTAPQPHVLVIGGGFGGVSAVKALAQAPVKVSLIDKVNHHLFQPLLYQVATGILNATEVATPLRQIFRDQENATVFLGEVTSIDLASRTFAVDGEKVPAGFDYLLLATGAEQSYFGRHDFAEFAPGLKSLSDAEYLRNKILSAFENAEKKLNPAAHPELLTFVLVGGGPSGVELAAAISSMARQTLASEYRRYDPRKLRVVLVQSGPRILPQFPEKLSQRALEHLQKIGIEIRLNSRVTGVDAGGIQIGNERIDSKTVIWTAGVEASPLIRSLGLPLDRGGRITVQDDCSVPDHPNVFIIGDAAAFSAGKGENLPGVAQVALQQGRYVGKLIVSRVNGREKPGPFRYFDKGSLAVVGRFYAVMDSFGIRTAGFGAFFIWAFVHVQFLATNFSRILTLLQWLWVIVTGQRTSCLIVQARGTKATPETLA